MTGTRRFVKVRPDLEDLGERIAPSAVSPAELFIDKQLTADIAQTATDFKTLTTDLKGTVATQDQINLDLLKVSRDLVIVAADQQLDVALDATPTPATPAEIPTTPTT